VDFVGGIQASYKKENKDFPETVKLSLQRKPDNNNCTYAVVQVLGQRVNEDDLAHGSRAIQAD